MEEGSDHNKSGPQDLEIPSNLKTENNVPHESLDKNDQSKQMELPNIEEVRDANNNSQGKDDKEAIEVKINDEEASLKQEQVLTKQQAKESPKNENPHYDFDQVPPLFDKAKVHGRSRRVYSAQTETEKHSHIMNHKTKKICDCCGNGYDLNKIGLCSSKSEMYHLGVGFPLYFDFIVYCGVLAMIMLLVSGIYNFVTNSNNEDCLFNLNWNRDDAQFCDSTRISRISLVNKRFSTNEIEISNWFNLAAVVVMVISFQFYRRQSILTIEEVDNSQQTPADYTLTISNLPSDATDQEVKDFMEKELFPEKQVKVAKVIRGYDITEYVKLTRRRAALKFELSKQDVKDKEKKEHELNQVRLSLEVFEQNSSLNLDKSPYAYVTFEREEHAREAVKRMGFNPPIKKLFYFLGLYSCFKDLRFRGKLKLRCYRAPEPTDILWENLGTDVAEKKKRRSITFLMSIIMIIICFGIIIGINLGKAKISTPNRLEGTNVQKSRSVGMEIISIVIAFVIMVINNALNYSIRIFASYESHSTFTDYFVSVAQRLTVAMFTNTAITLLVTHIILETLWKDGGLLNDLFVVFLITVVVGPLANLFNPWYFWRIYRRWKIQREGPNCSLTQREANLLFEGPPIDIAQCYANILKTVWVTAFYAPVLPIGIPISVVGLFISYWTDKYLLLNRYVKPSALGKSLSLWMAEYLELSPFFFAVGNIVFRSLIKKTPDDNIDDPILPTILALGISFAHFVIPVYPIAKKCFSSGERDSSYKQTYSDMRVAFNNDYDISNPIYRDGALQNWRKLVEQTANGESSAATGPQVSHNVKNALQNVRNYAQFAQGLSQVQNPHHQAGVPPARMLYPQVNTQPTNLNFGGAVNGVQSIPYQPVAYPQPNANFNASGPQYISGGAGFVQNQPNPAPRNMMTYAQPYQYPQYPPQQWQQQPQQPMMYPSPMQQHNNPVANQHIPRNIPYQPQYMMNPQNTYPMNQNQNQFNMELQPNYNNPPTRLNFYQGGVGPSQN